MLPIIDAFSSSDEARARNQARFFFLACVLSVVFAVLTFRELRYLIFSHHATVRVVQVTDMTARSTKVVTDLSIADSPHASFTTEPSDAPSVGASLNVQYLEGKPDSLRTVNHMRLLLLAPMVLLVTYLTIASVRFWRDFQRFQARKRATDD